MRLSTLIKPDGRWLDWTYPSDGVPIGGICYCRVADTYPAVVAWWTRVSPGTMQLMGYDCPMTRLAKQPV